MGGPLSRLADWAAARLQPQLVAPALEPLYLTPERYGSIERNYIVCTEDKMIPPDAQRQMLTRAGVGNVKEIDSGHSPFLSQPARLAEILGQLS